MASYSESVVSNRMNIQAQMYGNATAGRVAAGTASGRVAQKKKLSNNAYRAIMLSLIVLLVFFTFITFAMAAQKLQQSNNALESEIALLEAEIDSLNNQISDETNVSVIEQTATKKLGMVYPTSENYINLDKRISEDKTEGLAATIKAKAYK
ncbi:MAG: cell division protein FtsL [Firmicutes bacterium]|nr:cell division protein FtsL [Bacillota bacterium]